MVFIILLFGAKEVRKSPKIDDNVNLAKLGILDNISLVLSKMINNDAEELENAEKLSAQQLRMRGQLSDLIQNATKSMRDKGHTSVTLNIASDYIPYFDDVFSTSTGWGRWYDIIIASDRIPMNIKHFVQVTVKVKPK